MAEDKQHEQGEQVGERVERKYNTIVGRHVSTTGMKLVFKNAQDNIVIGKLRGDQLVDLTEVDQARAQHLGLTYTKMTRQDFIAEITMNNGINKYWIPSLRFALVNNENPITVTGYVNRNDNIVPLNDDNIQRCADLHFLTAQLEEKDDDDSDEDVDSDDDSAPRCWCNLRYYYRGLAFGSGIEFSEEEEESMETMYRKLLQNGVVPPMDPETYSMTYSPEDPEMFLDILKKNEKNLLLCKKFEREKEQKDIINKKKFFK